MIDKLFFYLEVMKTIFIFFCFPKNIYILKATRKNLENDIMILLIFIFQKQSLKIKE